MMWQDSSKHSALQATLERDAYLKRLGVLFTSSFCLLGGPIAYQTFDPFGQVDDHILPSCAFACSMPARFTDLRGSDMDAMRED